MPEANKIQIELTAVDRTQAAFAASPRQLVTLNKELYELRIMAEKTSAPVQERRRGSAEAFHVQDHRLCRGAKRKLDSLAPREFTLSTLREFNSFRSGLRGEGERMAEEEKKGIKAQVDEIRDSMKECDWLRDITPCWPIFPRAVRLRSTPPGRPGHHP